MPEFDASQYKEAWATLNRELNQIARNGLGPAMDALHRQQLAQGFIRDDLTGLERHVFHHPKDHQRYFSVQFNPARARRFTGSGRVTPPPGAVRVHDGCFLCLENIQWQQQGIEIGYELYVDDRGYIAWMNPYPLLPGHTVIASREHIAQAWHHDGAADTGKHLSTLIEDLIKLAEQLPGWIGFYNGQGAGASIPHHFHYQFFRRPDGYGAFPLELAATRRYIGGAGYPLAFSHWHGAATTVIRTATRWIGNWVQRPRTDIAALTANLVAVADDAGRVDLYFVPRDQARSRSAEMSGLIGGLEALGELVFSSTEEKLRLENGDVDYHVVERVLASVSVEI